MVERRLLARYERIVTSITCPLQRSGMGFTESFIFGPRWACCTHHATGTADDRHPAAPNRWPLMANLPSEYYKGQVPFNTEPSPWHGRDHADNPARPVRAAPSSGDQRAACAGEPGSLHPPPSTR